MVAAYLFGSLAMGRGHRESDVDVAVLLDRVTHPTALARAEERVRLSARLMEAAGRNDLDVVVLNDAPLELAREVVTRGRRLTGRDPEMEHAFVRDVLIRAADLAPFLLRMRRIKLEALRA